MMQTGRGPNSVLIWLAASVPNAVFVQLVIGDDDIRGDADFAQQRTGLFVIVEIQDLHTPCLKHQGQGGAHTVFVFHHQGDQALQVPRCDPWPLVWVWGC